MALNGAPRRDRDEGDAFDGGAGHSGAVTPAKRARGGARHHPREYIPGAVMKVKLHNFMTYSDVEMEPGPRLNVILGPNGTGKSSFVCALAIGLAGSTKLLGRADKISEFVKRGEQSGYSEITLATKNPNRPLVVRRDIKRKDGTSTWKVNGVTVPLERVKTEMRQLGVQLDNLCQFLPQDRVVEFARLTPEKLLQETEKAIGNAELYNLHAELIEEKSKIADLDRQVKAKNNKLENLKTEVEALQRDVARFNEREDLLKNAAVMKKKLPWLHFDIAKKKWHEAKDHVRKIKDKNAEMIKLKAKLEAAPKKLGKELANATGREKGLHDKLNTLVKNHKTIEGRLRDLSEQWDDKEQEVNNARAIAKQEQRKLQKMKDELASAEGDLAAVPEPPDNSEEIRELKTQARKIASDVLNLQDDITKIDMDLKKPEQDVLWASRQLDKLKSTKGKRLEQLARKYPRVLQAQRWVEENQKTFFGKVIGPILDCIECEDTDHRNYLQQQVPDYIFAAFVNTDPRDDDKLGEVFKRNNWGSLIHSPEPTWTYPDVSHLASKGVTHRLDQVIKADQAAMQVLCDYGGVHRAYIVDKKMKGEEIDRLMRSTDVSRVFQPETMFGRITSRYDRSAVSFSSSAVRKSSFFTTVTNAGEEKKLTRTLNMARDDVATLYRARDEKRKAISELDSKDINIQKRVKLLGSTGNELRAQRRTYQQRVMTMQDKIRRFVVRDPEVEEAKSREALLKLTREREKKATELVAAAADRSAAIVDWASASLRAKELVVQHAHAEEVLAAAVRDFTQSENEVREAEEKLKEAKRVAVDKKNTAKSFTDGKDIKDVPELNAQFETMAKTVESLEEEIHRIEDEADAIMCPNGMVLEDFKAKKDEIHALETGLVKEEDTLNAANAKIADIKGRWLPRLRELVEHINENFKGNFASIGCAGEVKLNEDAGESFEDWRLEIWVKFRASTDMHILDHHRQSGGERSVSTMLYLISLQELTNAPFRVVDEINQGMDPINERKIFRRMTDAASKDSTPQTFLLTPKLLNNLKYTEDCTVLCIFNGPWIAEVAKRWREMQRAMQPVASAPETP